MITNFYLAFNDHRFPIRGPWELLTRGGREGALGTLCRSYGVRGEHLCPRDAVDEVPKVDCEELEPSSTVHHVHRPAAHDGLEEQ